MKHSVCMAVYNGAHYIRAQIASILPQLGGDNEVVVVDDASLDASVAILEGFHDERIRIIRQTENRGALKTFERALREASGEIIFLSDQDDIWRGDKVATMMRAFAADPLVTLVLSNGEMIDSNGRSLSRQLGGKGGFLPGVVPNIMRNRYQGSTMAFRREILEAVLPFPDGIPMHDWWIGLINALIGRAVYLHDRLVFYRRHGGNVTSGRHGTVMRMFTQRWMLIKNLLYRIGTLARVRRELRQRAGSTAETRVDAKQLTIASKSASPRRAVVFAQFVGWDAVASRPRFVGSVLAELMPVDLVASDFDHTRKTKRDHEHCSPFEQVICLQTRPYYSNVSLARLISHLLFSFDAALYFSKNRDRYDVIYATAPLNVLAWLVFKQAGARTKIIDAVDIWPDVLPFPPAVRKILAPIFGAWKWFFKSAVAKADIVMAVSDVFLHEAIGYANRAASVKRFYIGHDRLVSTASKQPIFTVAYVGNLGRLYDFETLLDVLAEATLRSHVQLFVIGEGERQEWLVAELDRRMLRYRFFGAVFQPARLAEILRSCHAGFNGYINTRAAFSYKSATYFAAGLPIINSMKGDLQYLVEEHGLGENYEGGNRKQLSECFSRFLENGTAVMAANCERFFASHLESSKISADMKEFLVTKLNESQNSCDTSNGAGIKLRAPRKMCQACEAEVGICSCPAAGRENPDGAERAKILPAFTASLSSRTLRRSRSVERPVKVTSVRQRGWAEAAKRAADIMVALVGIVVMSPVLAVVGTVIWATMGSPVLFRQVRPGRYGKPFTLWKFRSMTDARNSPERLRDVDRLTKVGRYLRASSLDELPQLWNVLRGDLSLVGPRPLLTQYLERYTPEQARRHEVLPGMTGWAQVNGRNAIAWEDKFALDVWYVDHWSLLLDMRILCRTVRNVILREGITGQNQATAQEFLGAGK